jgi:hypothetical protein
MTSAASAGRNRPIPGPPLRGARCFRRAGKGGIPFEARGNLNAFAYLTPPSDMRSGAATSPSASTAGACRPIGRG